MTSQTTLPLTKTLDSKSVLNDQLVDMAFITAYTNMTDKWFYRLIPSTN